MLPGLPRSLCPEEGSVGEGPSGQDCETEGPRLVAYTSLPKLQAAALRGLQAGSRAVRAPCAARTTEKVGTLCCPSPPPPAAGPAEPLGEDLEQQVRPQRLDFLKRECKYVSYR